MSESNGHSASNGHKAPGKVGAPPKYSDPAVLQVKIDEYFALNEIREEFRPTITGLVLYCGFCDRASFYAMEKRKGFSHTIKNARSRIEAVYESRLHGANCAGAIFALKNFGWKDTPDVAAGQNITVIYPPDWKKFDDAVRFRQRQNGSALPAS